MNSTIDTMRNTFTQSVFFTTAIMAELCRTSFARTRRDCNELLLQDSENVSVIAPDPKSRNSVDNGYSDGYSTYR